MKLELREIKYKTSEYDLEIALRNKVLREPLGLQFSEEELSMEGSSVHLGAFIGEKLVGVLLLTPVDRAKMKMRQVAVATDTQRLGVGRSLVQASEAKAKQLGFLELVLSAREGAVPFYERLGYETVGERFTEVGIPHRKMRKKI